MNDHPPITITWHGHSTALVDVGGVRVLTDPLVTAAVAHLRRRRAAAPLPPVDAVVVSHVHMDHLHPRSLRQVVRPGTHVVVPAGAAHLLRGVQPARLDEVRVGDRVEVVAASGSSISIDAVPAQHSHSRGPHARRTAPALGFVMTAGARRVYFAGDTGPFDEMAALGPVDVALLPIWGWGSTLGEGHLDPTTAAEATERLQARRVIAVHWGTYSPRRVWRGAPGWLDRPVEAFRHALAARGLADRLVELLPGDTVTLDDGAPPQGGR